MELTISSFNSIGSKHFYGVSASRSSHLALGTQHLQACQMRVLLRGGSSDSTWWVLGNKTPDKSNPERSHLKISHPDIKPPGNKPPQQKASRKSVSRQKPPGKKPPGQKPPGKKPPGKKPPGKKPPGKKSHPVLRYMIKNQAVNKRTSQKSHPGKKPSEP